jgi:nucleotide-binding universal stress UspA family protein
MKTIVVGYDDTEPAQRALDRAAEIAEAFGAKLVVTSVAPVEGAGPRGGTGIDPTDTPSEHESQLARAQAKLAGRAVTVEFQPALGEPAEAIIEAAEHLDADMIVVGTREPGMLDRLFRGSVSAAVSRNATCDVLIVH